MPLLGVGVAALGLWYVFGRGGGGGTQGEPLKAWIHNDNDETRIYLSASATGAGAILTASGEKYAMGSLRTNTNYYIFGQSFSGAASEPSDVEVGTVYDTSADGTVDPQNTQMFAVVVNGVMSGQKIRLPSVTLHEDTDRLIAQISFQKIEPLPL